MRIPEVKLLLLPSVPGCPATVAGRVLSQEPFFPFQSPVVELWFSFRVKAQWV